jgi:hypothetical protein
MLQKALLALFAVLLLGACADDAAPIPQPALLSYWRPISNPNVNLGSTQAAQKLNFDLAQCRCNNYPVHVPHQEMGQMMPDVSRLAETSATKIDAGVGCSTSSNAVLIECMRWRGWEPSQCSGRMNTPGGTQCALSIHNLPSYPDEYPYKGPVDQGFGDSNPTPAQIRQRYP